MVDADVAQAALRSRQLYVRGNPRELPAPAKPLKQAAMFQTFESQSERGAATERIKELRRLMAAAKLDAYLVPRADEHQGEYVPACSARLKWLTGFSGSAGLAIVTKKSATLFVDGRYTVQARAEVEPGLIDVSSVARAAPSANGSPSTCRAARPSVSIRACTPSPRSSAWKRC